MPQPPPIHPVLPPASAPHSAFRVSSPSSSGSSSRCAAPAPTSWTGAPNDWRGRSVLERTRRSRRQSLVAGANPGAANEGDTTATLSPAAALRRDTNLIHNLEADTAPPSRLIMTWRPAGRCPRTRRFRTRLAPLFGVVVGHLSAGRSEGKRRGQGAMTAAQNCARRSGSVAPSRR